MAYIPVVSVNCTRCIRRNSLQKFCFIRIRFLIFFSSLHTFYLFLSLDRIGHSCLYHPVASGLDPKTMIHHTLLWSTYPSAIGIWTSCISKHCEWCVISCPYMIFVSTNVRTPLLTPGLSVIASAAPKVRACIVVCTMQLIRFPSALTRR